MSETMTHPRVQKPHFEVEHCPECVYLGTGYTARNEPVDYYIHPFDPDPIDLFIITLVWAKDKFCQAMLGSLRHSLRPAEAQNATRFYTPDPVIQEVVDLADCWKIMREQRMN